MLDDAHGMVRLLVEAAKLMSRFDAVTARLPTRLRKLAREAQKRIDTANMAVVVVGDRKTIEAPLRALGLGPFAVRTLEDVMGPPPRVD